MAPYDGAKCVLILIVIGIHSAGDKNFVNSLLEMRNVIM